MVKTIKKSEAVNILDVFLKTANHPKMPLKFCIARNVKVLKPIVDKYEEDKDILFKAAVKLDADGNGCLKEGVVIESNRVAFDMFEYNSDSSKEKFFQKIAELNNETVEVDFVQENLHRPVKISMQDGSYSEATIENVLEDPNNNITPIMIALFLDYILEG